MYWFHYHPLSASASSTSSTSNPSVCWVYRHHSGARPRTEKVQCVIPLFVGFRCCTDMDGQENECVSYSVTRRERNTNYFGALKFCEERRRRLCTLSELRSSCLGILMALSNDFERVFASDSPTLCPHRNCVKDWKFSGCEQSPCSNPDMNPKGDWCPTKVRADQNFRGGSHYEYCVPCHKCIEYGDQESCETASETCSWDNLSAQNKCTYVPYTYNLQKCASPCRTYYDFWSTFLYYYCDVEAEPGQKKWDFCSLPGYVYYTRALVHYRTEYCGDCRSANSNGIFKCENGSLCSPECVHDVDCKDFYLSSCVNNVCVGSISVTVPPAGTD
eukprot:GEMP01025843.1.p1 GENE.GEMP01025843.1~~GEMP01025843.1.p1  ORF type:complete len:331 (+),score=3.52 GEMP01025843.1:527-1519(+)